MINKSTILQLYCGELYPAETIVPFAPEYRKNCSKIEQLHEKISSLLKLEDKNLVEDFRDSFESVISLQK